MKWLPLALQIVVGLTQTLPDGHTVTTWSNGVRVESMPDRLGGQQTTLTQPAAVVQVPILQPPPAVNPLPAVPLQGRR